MATKSQRVQYASPGQPASERPHQKRLIDLPLTQNDGKSDKEEPVSRLSYQPPPELRWVDPLRAHKPYFTDLQTTFSDLCHDLLSQPTLAYNPYPGMVAALRRASEKFHFYQQPDSEIHHSLKKHVVETAVPHLCRTPNDPPIYGLRGLLQLVDPRGVDQYRWLVDNVTPPLADLPSLPGHSIQVLMALSGPAVFTGTFYKQPQRAHLRQEYLVTGSDRTKAMDLFVSSVIQDLNRMEKKRNHKVIGIHVPSQILSQQETMDTNKNLEEIAMETPWTDELWEVDRVHLEKDNFVRAVTEAVLGNKVVTMECVFCLDPSALVFVFGEKQSSLNFVEIGEKDTSEGLSTFTQYPLATLHEGVFLKKSHAEAYMGMFLPMLLGHRPHKLVIQDKASSITMTTRGRGKHKDVTTTKGTKQHPEAKEGMPKLSTLVSMKKFFRDRASKSRTVQLDGFRFEEIMADGPCASQITGPIRSLWQEKMSWLMPELQLFECLHYVMLLSVMDGSSHDIPLYTELSGASVSTAARFHALLEELRVMSATMENLYQGLHTCRALGHEGDILSLILCVHIKYPSITVLENTAEPGETHDQLQVVGMPCTAGEEASKSRTWSWTLNAWGGKEKSISRVLKVFKQKMEDLFGNKLRECSSEEVSLCHVIASRITALMKAEKLIDSDIYVRQLTATLQQLTHLCQTLFISLAETVLHLCPQIQKCLKNVQKTFAKNALLETNRKPQAKMKQTKGSKGANLKPGTSVTGKEAVVHGMEDMHLSKHDIWVIRVSECAETDPSPKAVNTEAVLMKYLLDIHLDEVWWNYLLELFSSDITPPNPYPRLITSLRRAALKMDLWFEAEEMLKQKIFNGVSKPTHDFPFVHVIPGCGAHGSAGIMSVLNTEAYFAISNLSQDFIPSFYVQMKGLFRVALCTAVTGQSALYGRLVPYLSTLELDEHIYIKGPEGCSTEAVQLCANIVHREILDLINQGKHPVTGVFFGTHQNRLTMQDVKLRPQAFLSEFETTCHNRQHVFLKAYIAEGWRYYPVIKHYKLHWLTENSSETFYPADPSEFYKSVFFEKERAAFYHQTSLMDFDDPQGYAATRNVSSYLDEKIVQVIRDEHDYLHVHKLLCSHALVKQDDLQLMESWRMFHSLAGQVEYVNTLNTTLQDLVGFTLERKIESKNTRQQSLGENAAAVESGLSGDSGKTDTVLGPLKVGTLNFMAVAFRQKILDVTESAMTLASPRIPLVLGRKLESVFVNSELLVQEQTIVQLEEIRNMMDAIGHMVSCDLHKALPLASKSVDKILIGPDARSRRVLSANLDKPEAILKRPRAGMTVQ